MGNSALAPCPFCGDRSGGIDCDERGEWMFCDGCGAEGPKAADPAQAALAWDRRARDAGLSHDLTVIAEACEENASDWRSDGCEPAEAAAFAEETGRRVRRLLTEAE
jgi:hypothetical protein